MLCILNGYRKLAWAKLASLGWDQMIQLPLGDQLPLGRGDNKSQGKIAVSMGVGQFQFLLLAGGPVKKLRNVVKINPVKPKKTYTKTKI